MAHPVTGTGEVVGAASRVADKAPSRPTAGAQHIVRQLPGELTRSMGACAAVA
jgi:hypothetical protein